MRPRHLVVAAALSLACAAPALGAEPYVAIKGAPAAGPARYDKVFVQKFGSAKARRVLVGIGVCGRRGRLQADRARSRAACARAGGLGPGSPPAGVRGHLGLCVRRPRASRGLLPRLQVPADTGRQCQVRREVGLGVALRDLRRVVLKARAEVAEGDPGGALAWSVDHGGLRLLGLQRTPGLPRHRRHGADRRRAAGLVRQRLAWAGEAHPGRVAPGRGVRRSPGPWHTRGDGFLCPARGAVRAQAA